MMDIKFTKHSVKSEELLVSDTFEFQMEETAQIHCKNEVKRIIKCSSKSVLTSEYISDKTITFEGTVTVCIIYIDGKNCLANHEHTMFFSKTIETNYDLSDAEVEGKVFDDKFTVKLKNDNSVSIIGSVCVQYSAYKIYSKEIVCDIYRRTIEQLRQNTECTTPTGKGEKNLVIEEEISIGNSQPSVESVIRSNAVAVIDDTKIMGGKVMVKGTIKTYVLYQTTEGTRPQSFAEDFPFSQMVDVEGIHDNCKCDSEVKVVFCELTPRPSQDEEIRSFSVALKLTVSVKAYCDEEIPTVIDAYSTGAGYNFVKDKFTFKKIKDCFVESFVAKKNLEFTDGAVGSVIDMWCENKSSSAKFEDNTLKISGTMIVSLLVYDCDGNPECFERPVDYEYTYISKETMNNPMAVYDISVKHCSYTITGANTISVAIEPQVSIKLYDTLQYEFITDAIEDENCCSDKKFESSIVLYFADKGEKVWDIARRYNSSVEEIKALNNISEDILTESRKFIIPTK